MQVGKPAWKMIVNLASVTMEDVLSVYWAKDDLQTSDFAKDLHGISEPAIAPELHVSQGALAEPVDGDLSDMLIHTRKNENLVASGKS